MHPPVSDVEGAVFAFLDHYLIDDEGGAVDEPELHPGRIMAGLPGQAELIPGRSLIVVSDAAGPGPGAPGAAGHAAPEREGGQVGQLRHRELPRETRRLDGVYPPRRHAAGRRHGVQYQLPPLRPDDSQRGPYTTTAQPRIVGVWISQHRPHMWQ